MKVIIAIFLSASVGIVPGAGQEAQNASLPTEINQALAPVQALEAKAAEAKQKRLDQYVADLEKLEKTVARETSDLEQVIVVREEKEAWAKGEKTDPIDPKDESKPLSLRKLRYYFDQDLAKLENTGAETLAKAREQAVANLRELEAQFTREKKIELAVAARKEREGLQARSVSSKSPLAIPQSVERNLKGESLPFRNDEPGELNAWGKNSQGIKIAESLPDSGKFVSIHAFRTLWAAFEKRGDVLVQQIGGRTIRADDRAGISTGYSPAWVRNDGTVMFRGASESIYQLNDVVAIACGTTGGSFDTGYVLTEDGTIHPSIPLKERTPPDPARLKNTALITCSGGLPSLFSVKTDGSNFAWNPKSPGEVLEMDSDGERIVELVAGLSSCVGLSENGNIFIWPDSSSRNLPPEFSAVPNDKGPFTTVRVSGGTGAARKQDGSWVAWGHNPSNVIEKIESLGIVKDLDFECQLSGQPFAWIIWIE